MIFLNKKFLFTTLGFVTLLLVWQIANSLHPHLQFILPAPSHIFHTLIECKSRFLFHTLATIKEILGGFILACCASFPLAWIMIRFKHSRSFLQPLFIIVQSLPMFALAPIMVIWCGWGYTAIVLPTALMIFFPLTLNLYQGLRSTPTALLDFFRINGATESQTLFKLRLPWALPHLFSGLRIAAAIAGMGAIAGEWAGAQKGLGILMLESRRNFDLEVTFGALFCLTLLTLSLYALILFAEFLSLRRHTLRFSFALPPFLSRFPQRRFAFPLLCSMLIFFSTSSCHYLPKKEQTILMLDWLPNHNHIPLYAGIAMGFFAEEEIELTLQKMHESGGVLSYLLNDKVDLAIHHMPAALRAEEKGAPITFVASLIPTPLHALIYREDSTIQTPSDLSGKVLGYCIGGSDTSFLDYLLTKNKIFPKERKNISVDLISAMATRNVDFIYGGFWNVEPHLFQSYGIPTSYFKMDELMVPSYEEMIIIAREGSPHCDASFISRFQRALQKSITFCKNDPDQAFALYAAYHPDKREKTLTWEKAAWQETYPLLAESQDLPLAKRICLKEWIKSTGTM